MILLALLTACSKPLFPQEELFENAVELDLQVLDFYENVYGVYTTEGYITIVENNGNKVEFHIYNENNVLLTTHRAELPFELDDINDDIYIYDSGVVVGHQTTQSTILYNYSFDTGFFEKVYEIDNTNNYEKYQINMLKTTEFGFMIVLKSSNIRYTEGYISFSHIILEFNDMWENSDTTEINDIDYYGLQNVDYYYADGLYGILNENGKIRMFFKHETVFKEIESYLYCEKCYTITVNDSVDSISVYYIKSNVEEESANLYRISFFDGEFSARDLILEDYLATEYIDYHLNDELLVNVNIQGLTVEQKQGDTFASIIVINLSEDEIQYIKSDSYNTLSFGSVWKTRIYLINHYSNEVLYIDLPK